MELVSSQDFRKNQNNLSLGDSEFLNLVFSVFLKCSKIGNPSRKQRSADKRVRIRVQIRVRSHVRSKDSGKDKDSDKHVQGSNFVLVRVRIQVRSAKSKLLSVSADLCSKVPNR